MREVTDEMVEGCETLLTLKVDDHSAVMTLQAWGPNIPEGARYITIKLNDRQVQAFTDLLVMFEDGR